MKRVVGGWERTQGGAGHRYPNPESYPQLAIIATGGKTAAPPRKMNYMAGVSRLRPWLPKGSPGAMLPGVFESLHWWLGDVRRRFVNRFRFESMMGSDRSRLGIGQALQLGLEGNSCPAQPGL